MKLLASHEELPPVVTDVGGTSSDCPIESRDRSGREYATDEQVREVWAKYGL
jgi:hypothetical protein